VVKTVAAFLNSSGGTLGIGITDDGDICGLQHDLDYKHQDLDGYQNWLTTLARDQHRRGSCRGARRYPIESVGSEVVCLVDVSRRPSGLREIDQGRRVLLRPHQQHHPMLEGPTFPPTSTATGRSREPATVDPQITRWLLVNDALNQDSAVLNLRQSDGVLRLWIWAMEVTCGLVECLLDGVAANVLQLGDDVLVTDESHEPAEG
jgi:hypothetical protein